MQTQKIVALTQATKNLMAALELTANNVQGDDGWAAEQQIVNAIIALNNGGWDMSEITELAFE